MFTKILFAHDGGMAAERVLVYLEHVARTEQAEVIVLHVYELPERYVATEGYEDLRDQYRAVAQEVVDDAVAYLEERGITAQGLALAGDPANDPTGGSARAILETAEQKDVSLIVMGTRGASSMAELLLGNVTIEVLRFARCPVLVVP
jgi:nucleotide-binding universal stress UspA family protein